MILKELHKFLAMKITRMLLSTVVTVLALSLSFASVAAPSNEPLSVQITGNGQPILLIPGLTCGGDVWQTTVDHLSPNYKCYVFTLAGFAGQPPIQTNDFLKTERNAIEKYVRDNKIKYPIVIGHSLGGFLAWWLAIDQPKMFKAVVAVDGLPFLAPMVSPAGTAAQDAVIAKSFKTAFAKMTPAQFAASTKMALTFQITSPAQVNQFATTCSKSDPATAGEAMSEMMTIDLRPEMFKVKMPALLFMSAAFYTAPDALSKMKSSYQSQIAGDPTAQLAVALKARHFIFLDDPHFFFTTLDAFLKPLK